MYAYIYIGNGAKNESIVSVEIQASVNSQDYIFTPTAFIECFKVLASVVVKKIDEVGYMS